MKTRRLAISAGCFAVALQVAGRVVMSASKEPALQMAAAFVVLFGMAVLITSVRTIAVSKGRHPGWSLLGLFSFVGLIIIVCLKDLRAARNGSAGRSTGG